MDGKQIRTIDRIRNKECYVATGVERFLPRRYGNPLPRLITAKRRRFHDYVDVRFIDEIPDECHTQHRPV
ncbi:hypothetical protein AHF37_12009 [Paragonimus kellicotti]|nr:hypothetical protein AHF37_12009 [Paragonimus kellicotti]